MQTEQKQQALNILVIGANGGIGLQTVTIALNAGHRVTALVRNPANLTLTHANLEIVQGDIRLPKTFEKHLENKDAVVSALGENMNKPTTLYSDGNRNLLNAMKKMHVKRAFFISAAAIEVSPAQSFFIRLVTKFIVQKLFGHGYADQRVMEKLIKESGTDWTIMRPPRLINKSVSGNYRVAINTYLKNCLSISRADVAHFMVNSITNQATYKAIVEIAY